MDLDWAPVRPVFNTWWAMHKFFPTSDPYNFINVEGRDFQFSGAMYKSIYFVKLV